MNIFIHHRDLRYIDNTTLIEQTKHEGKIIPLFVFDPKQIDRKKNKYFSNNAVQFMVESLRELQKDYKKHGGDLHCFKGDYITILKEIHKTHKINSVGFNIDYSPYAKSRDEKIKKYCKSKGIRLYVCEDMLLHNITTMKTVKQNTQEPYKVFTPFKKFVSKQSVRAPNKFKAFQFESNKFTNNKYVFRKLESIFEPNTNVLVKGVALGQ